MKAKDNNDRCHDITTRLGPPLVVSRTNYVCPTSEALLKLNTCGAPGPPIPCNWFRCCSSCKWTFLRMHSGRQAENQMHLSQQFAHKPIKKITAKNLGLFSDFMPSKNWAQKLKTCRNEISRFTIIISTWLQKKSTRKSDSKFLCPTLSETKLNFRSP